VSGLLFRRRLQRRSFAPSFSPAGPALATPADAAADRVPPLDVSAAGA